jgi:hypothetical protein
MDVHLVNLEWARAWGRLRPRGTAASFRMRPPGTDPRSWLTLQSHIVRFVSTRRNPPRADSASRSLEAAWGEWAHWSRRNETPPHNLAPTSAEDTRPRRRSLDARQASVRPTLRRRQSRVRTQVKPALVAPSTKSSLVRPPRPRQVAASQRIACSLNKPVIPVWRTSRLFSVLGPGVPGPCLVTSGPFCP